MYDPRRDTYTVTISGRLLAMAQTNQGAFVSALRHEMEDAMNTQQYDPVKEAKAQLKQALAADKAARKAAKEALRVERQRQADRELALDTLREIAANFHEDASQRMGAVDRLLLLV